jgi:hypothetical protein
VRALRSRIEAALFVLALALALLGALGRWDETVANTLTFVAWCAALLLLFSLGLRLPLHLRGRLATPAALGLVVLALGIVLLANIALYRHDAHFDVTASGRYTAPAQLTAAARGLDRDVAVTYFYNSQDPDALTARDVLLGEARHFPRLHVRALDLDKELVAARALGVRMYNSAVAESEGRRTMIDNTVDLRDVAFAIERVIRRRSPTVCFLTGHGEPYERAGHVHLSHEEIYRYSETTTLDAPAQGVDRLRLALEAIGYVDRAVALPTAAAPLPEDCDLLAEVGPRSAYAPREVATLRAYLAQGGRLLLMLDPEFPVTPELGALLATLGLEVGTGMVLDPLNHAGPEPDKVAIPYYPPHPITGQIALTVFPGPRPIRLTGPVAGIEAAELVSTSKDSYVRAPATNVAALAAAPAIAAAEAAAPRGARTLAAAVQGTWPEGGGREFRLVLVGSAAFATNAFFPYASNGELAISMLRWLAGDMKAPRLRPVSYSVPQIDLTARQMQATFLVVEVLLPLSVVLVGVLVWRRRR